MQSVPFEFVSQLASEFGAFECCWRESDLSFTGYVAECWFHQLPGPFCVKWSSVVGYQVRVRCFSQGSVRCFVASVPVTVPQGSIRLAGGQRGGRARVVFHPDSY
ncbi:hypothetical protein Lepto7375DRAFT_0948 [Leptolyngbya sp. PCC 7375]|nr:hypothetical protein Lepto7375DRAFT_0948 [Leptolyngbya sp. PCC 7375]